MNTQLVYLIKSLHGARRARTVDPRIKKFVPTTQLYARVPALPIDSH